MANKLHPRAPAHHHMRLLILEDSPADVELAVAVLKKAGYSPSFKVVETPEQFQEQLEQDDCDLILADYNLGAWTAMDALAMVKESAKDVPFVVVTGTLGDEAAVECFKQGATDYVLKHRLQRLPVVVDRALRDKAHRVEAARLEKEIRHAKKEWELTVDAVPDPILLLDPQYRIQRTNRAAAVTFGLEFSQMIGRLCYEVACLKSEPPADCPVRRMLETGSEEGVDLEYPHLGKTFYSTTSPLRDPSGHLQGCVHVLRDVTDRKRAEEALRTSETRYRRLFEAAKDGILILDGTTGQIRDVNPFLEGLLGYPHEAFVGKQLWEIGAFKDIAACKLAYEGLDEKEYIRYEELPLQASDGRAIEVEFVSNAYRVDGRRVIQCNIRDITERKRAEEAMRRSEASYRSLILGATYGIFRCDVEGKFVTVNPALANMLGYESEAELLGANLVNHISRNADAGAQLLRQYRQKGRVEGMEGHWKRKDGTPITVRLSGRTVLDEQGALQGFEVLAEDVTERRQLEDQLRQAQKMEAIGQLAGGVAHDFNNLLTIINGYSQLLLDRLDSADTRWGFADEVRRAGERAATLTRQLLAFSRRQVLAPQILDLNTVVTGVEKMLQRLIGEDIQLVTAMDAGLGQVRADPGQIELVILNLAVNARDAMPQGGKLTIETANVELDSEYVMTHALAAPGPHVMLAVSDTGCGMDRDTLGHIFEPFFTTKEQGKGTGLGLATVYGIVRQSGGNIWVYSEPGKGTTFKIYLPRLQEAVATAAPAEGRDASPQGSETILVVEDDAAVRPLVRGVLLSKGYSVLEASQGDEALSVSESHRGPIELLVTDIVMPVMTGRDLAEQLLLRHPETRILYMSGFADDAMVHQGVLEDGAAFLQKPFSPDALARKVREVLDAPRPAR